MTTGPLPVVTMMRGPLPVVTRDFREQDTAVEKVKTVDEAPSVWVNWIHT